MDGQREREREQVREKKRRKTGGGEKRTRVSRDRRSTREREKNKEQIPKVDAREREIESRVTRVSLVHIYHSDYILFSPMNE
jgi:hypothetical protein